MISRISRDARALAVGGLGGLVVGAGAAAGAIVLAERDGMPASRPANGEASAPAAAPPLSFANIIEKVSPAVVSVHVASARPATSGLIAPGLPFVAPGRGPQGYVVRGQGSGFIISPDGYVVTNNHVVQGSREIRVTLGDARELPARIVGRDEPTDLAVLKVEGRDLPYVSFDDAATPRVGDWVVAVGSPFGLEETATAGIVSAYAREIGEAYVSFIQTDAAINRGNSGGPMFDVRGRVIGVNTAIASPSGGFVGVGFAIPAEVAEGVTRELIATGRVTRGYIGAAVQTLAPALADRLGIARRKGALIASVSRPGPAASAGLRRGDLVVEIEGDPITSSADLARKVGGAKGGIACASKSCGRAEASTSRSGPARGRRRRHRCAIFGRAQQYRVPGVLVCWI